MRGACARSSIAGLACQDSSTIDGTILSPWRVGNRALSGIQSFPACDAALRSADDDRPWCTTARSGRWEDGWDFCAPGCARSCPRATSAGKRCLAEWAVDDQVVRGCTTRNALFEWCATAASGDYRDGWGWCAPGCLEHARPPPSPPTSPPPSSRTDCQRATFGAERCLDRWTYRGVAFSQCTTAFSRSGAAWCKTYEEAISAEGEVAPGDEDGFNSAFGWCKPGCWEAARALSCQRTTTYGKPCLSPSWIYLNHRYEGCTSEDGGGYECVRAGASRSAARSRPWPRKALAVQGAALVFLIGALAARHGAQGRSQVPPLFPTGVGRCSESEAP
ncbi:hypothetical protein KFE25_008855 [Diacronema lutheri]|uniref:Uncharacterized protein n=1 Tax=Diacronema lutheri TaxID=2081491 RepID=A0A8J5Y3F8_DIALT|nr:hypothetical protein KFE25_008855 [Diacronema lutheri]